MNIFSFKKDAHLLARIEVLETRVAILEGMVRALTVDKKANDAKDEFDKEYKLLRQREYARKYYEANKEAIKAKKRDKRPLVSPDQLELPEMAVGGTQ
jgi:hypothetical protein